MPTDNLMISNNFLIQAFYKEMMSWYVISIIHHVFYSQGKYFLCMCVYSLDILAFTHQKNKRPKILGELRGTQKVQLILMILNDFKNHLSDVLIISSRNLILFIFFSLQILCCNYLVCGNLAAKLIVRLRILKTLKQGD